VYQKTGQGGVAPIEQIPGRIETVVRTNYMDAYNAGRQAVFTDSDIKDEIPAYQYSAIMDGRTSDVCDGLDGNIYKSNNPIWSQIWPPLHFNCRSIVVPIFADEFDGVESKPPTIMPEPGFGG